MADAYGTGAPGWAKGADKGIQKVLPGRAHFEEITNADAEDPRASTRWLVPPVDLVDPESGPT